MNIVLLGSPASGKGTQAEILAKKLHLYHFQTGELARHLAEKNPRIAEIINSGKLIPAEEMTMYAIDYLNEKTPDLKNVLFEGFPRFISQYEALSEFLKTKGDGIDAVISLEVSEDAAIARISARRTCEDCGEVYNLTTNPPKVENICDKCGGKLVHRDDDKPEAIKTRFKYYHENTQELMEYLDKKGMLLKVNGEGDIEKISEEIMEKLKK